MSAPLNRVEITGKPPAISVLVDGRLLPCESAVLELGVDSLPVLTVALPVMDGLVVTLDGAIGRFAEDTRAALLAMGWTPPGEPVVTGPPAMTGAQAREFQDAMKALDPDSWRHQLIVLPPAEILPAELAWLSVFSEADRARFRHEVLTAVTRGDMKGAEDAVAAWRVTAEMVAGQIRREAEFSELQQPGEPDLCRRCDVYIGYGGAGVVMVPEEHADDPEWLGSHCWLCGKSGEEIISGSR